MPVAKVSGKAARTSLGAGVVAAPEASDARALRSPYAPADPAQGLGEHEVAAILELKRAHPSMGPAQPRAQLREIDATLPSALLAHVDALLAFEPSMRPSHEW